MEKRTKDYRVIFIESREVFGITWEEEDPWLHSTLLQYKTLSAESSKYDSRVIARIDTVDMSTYLCTDPFEWENHQIDLICMMMPNIERSLLDKAACYAKMLKGKI